MLYFFNPIALQLWPANMQNQPHVRKEEMLLQMAIMAEIDVEVVVAVTVDVAKAIINRPARTFSGALIPG